MRRLDLVMAAKKVESLLARLHLFELARRAMLGAPEGGNLHNTLAAFREYTLAVSEFGESERQLLRSLQLESLEEPETWAGFLDAGKATRASPEAMGNLAGSLHRAVEVLPMIVTLLDTEALRLASAVRASSADGAGEDLLSVVVLEDERVRSTPERLIAVFESVAAFYEVAAVLHGDSGARLSVVGCDSGSDKSFDFLGVANLMQEVREIVISLWDRVVFFRERQMAARVELIANSVPILERIESLKGNGALSPEQAEILKRKVIEGSAKFIESGSTIPELYQLSSVSVRQLVQPAPRLLSGPVPESAIEPAAQKTAPHGRGARPTKRRASGQDSGEAAEPKEKVLNEDGDGLTDEEAALLRRILEKRHRK